MMDKKRICFISLGNLYLSPYISKYVSLIDCEYDVIYWDRHGLEEEIGAKTTFAFHRKMNEGSGKLAKIIGYLNFRRYALNIISKNSYDGIILLQTSVGILLQLILTKKYKYKYIVDIRDYTMEKNPVFYNIEKCLLKNSAYSVISSKGYQSFLPAHDYILAHNVASIDEEIIEDFKNRKRKKNKIIISYIGLIRFHEMNKKVILKFKDDNRFILKFIGKDAYALREFCEVNNIVNVELIDMFPPNKTLEYYYDTDIIYNLYGNNSPLLDHALSNKLYYAAQLCMPILVCPNTYMHEVTTDCGFGFTFDIDDEAMVDKLFEFYQKIDWESFDESCDKFMVNVKREDEEFGRAIRAFAGKLESVDIQYVKN